MKTELELLEERKAQILRRQATCNHEWGEPFYDPEKKEIMEYETKWMGVDCFGVAKPTGRFQTIDRWCRICKKCEKKEYTTEKEAVVVQTRPKFK